MRIALRSLLFSILLLSSLRPGQAAETIPIRYQDGLVWVQVAVPGRAAKLNFLLDSGAGVSVLDRGTAQALHLPLGAAEAVRGVQGAVRARWIEHFSGQVGTAAVPPRLLALDLRAVSRACHQQIDGLIGADFLRTRIVQLDFAAGTLRLLQQEEVNPAGSVTLPLARRGDALCTRVSVAHQPEVWVRVDTGCDTALRWVTNMPLDLRKNHSSTLGLAAPASRYMMTDVQLGSLKYHDIRTGIHARPIFPGEAGLLGNGLLSRFRLTFDAPGHRLLLQPR